VSQNDPVVWPQQNEHYQTPQGQKSNNQKKKEAKEKAKADAKKTTGFGCLFVVGILLFALAMIFWDEGLFEFGDDDTTVVGLSQQDTDDLVRRLAEAEKAHGVCYGWKLINEDADSGKDTVVSEGSSRGAGISAENLDDCAEYAVITVEIDYASSTSSFEDNAYISMTGSRAVMANKVETADFDRMGVTKEAAIAEPASTTGMGALAMPYLLVERGVVPAVPAADAAPAQAPAQPPVVRPGSDFVGNNTGALITVYILGGIAVLAFIVGLLGVRGRRRAAETR
jgi:hypothetical protein